MLIRTLVKKIKNEIIDEFQSYKCINFEIKSFY